MSQAEDDNDNNYTTFLADNDLFYHEFGADNKKHNMRESDL